MSADARGLSPTIRNYRKRAHRQQQRLSDLITRFSGSMTFVALHAVWFTVWIVLNQTLADPFDPFPYGLLTLVVSLEAIFLSTFVLISQNRQSADSDSRAREDFETDVYSEALNELIAARLGIDSDAVERLYRERLAQAKASDD